MSTPSSSSALSKRNRSGASNSDSNDPEDASAGASKKTRASTSSSSLSPPPLPAPRTRSTRFYFSDGNIILQVQETDFRVHRGVLESQPSVFKDMFEVGREGEHELQLKEKEGVATVELAHDFAGAWEVMLAVLYDGLSFALDDVSFDNLYALLHLSDKYEFTSQLALAQRLLLKESNTLLTPSFDRTDLTKPDLVSGLSATTLLRVLDLGKRFDVPEALPKAFYLLAKINRDLEQIVEEEKQDESGTGWEVRPFERHDVLRILKITRDSLGLQTSFESSFRLSSSSFHVGGCNEFEACRQHASTEFMNSWTPMTKRSHVDYRAMLLLMINSPWVGKPACKEMIVKWLERKLRHFDKSL